jgi:hypothetical protein
MTVDPESLYVQLGRLAEAIPLGLGQDYPTPATFAWLGKLSALVEVVGNIGDSATLSVATDNLSEESLQRLKASNQIVAVLYRALARAELKAPASVQGAFIFAAHAFDAFAAVGKVLTGAKQDILIVDPYLDEKVLTDFAPQAPEQVSLRLLADANDVKPSLKPAAERWRTQYPAVRRLEAKLAAARDLHDRLIIVDGADAWILTQSLNAFAARSPASIVKSGPDQAARKIRHYESVWTSASAL